MPASTLPMHTRPSVSANAATSGVAPLRQASPRVHVTMDATGFVLASVLCRGANARWPPLSSTAA